MNNFVKIIDDICAIACGKPVWVAYSGGIDSHVLLHLLATSGRSELNNLRAIHINHGLHADSALWSQHCAEVAAALQVNFTSVDVEVNDIAQLGLEAAARQARYQALQQAVSTDDLLLTAQHQNDQAETLLLQLLRGAGPKGLAGMASQSRLGNAILLRPFLEVSQAEIVAYAKQHNLSWIDDPSNVETRWARNFIRHELWPTLESRWPSAAKTLSRSAQHCADASQLLDELAQSDLNTIVDDNQGMSISALLALNPARQRNVLRYYIGKQSDFLPSSSVLEQILTELCHAKHDATPLVEWSNIAIRRYQQQLYILDKKHEQSVFCGPVSIKSLDSLTLADGRVLQWKPMSGNGFSRAIIEAGLTLSYRQGGEQIKLHGAHHSSLKKLLQQWAVPPWLRGRIPLVYREDELIAVVGYGLAEAYTVAEYEQGYLPVIALTE